MWCKPTSLLVELVLGHEKLFMYGPKSRRFHSDEKWWIVTQVVQWKYSSLKSFSIKARSSHRCRCLTFAT